MTTRQHWVDLADRMLAAAAPFASPGHARIAFPGPQGGYGHDVDGLEGFARTFLLAGFRIAGERGAGLDELADRYMAGIAAGTDPASPERWVRLDEHPQAKVEAASIALILDLTRPWIWDRLKPEVQERVVEYLSPAVGDPTYPRINWVWFRLVVQTFLRSVGGPWSAGEMAEDLATHDTFQRADGWMSDGPERSYDHYVGWALHLYPALWARMAGAADFAAPRRERDVAMLDRFLLDAVALVGADGSPLIQGRSLIYRFAAAAPFWVGALAEVPSLSPGLLRRAATGVLSHFTAHSVPDERGLLTLGWHGAWPRLAQSYSGPGSPYWASKGLLGLALPADHPVWTSAELPLPVEEGDTLRTVGAPGWLISATRADGIVRVLNHGTDHAVEGSTGGDSPLYARLGYSTATSPILDESGWVTPLDQSVTLVDDAGRATHRAGMSTVPPRLQDGLGIVGSTTQAHWVDPHPGQPDHGSGRKGDVQAAGCLTVFSLARGAWELRLSRVDTLAAGVEAKTLRLRVGGWPVAGRGEVRIATGSVTATGDGLTSRAHCATGEGVAGITRRADGGPLGGRVSVPWLEYPVRLGAWIACLIELSGGDQPPDRQGCRVVLTQREHDLDVRIDWPDGVQTLTCLENTNNPGHAIGAAHQHTGPASGPD
ncbi:hypothetical protein Rhe02_35760 [Rhizocola hellebori]|uniref:DUF2264 domain-containing protein n=1 Tax=Rhizocola hellebori TaxID=1392758 RepID=A0A8J3Q8P8_9ACTN|nr:DUF2264 domain-containing protein [Rhizocola hellebori]GIH05509.1 hypothetical protein Rhe02_35760 [Rhizocola hellebori]